MKLYETLVVKYLAALLTESRRQTFLQSKAVRLLSQIAGDLDDGNVAVSAHLTVETRPEGRR